MSPVSRQDLRNALAPVLQSLGRRADLDRRNGTRNVAQPDVFYEAYLYAVLIEVLQNLGASPAAVPLGPTFHFRRGPGVIGTTPGTFSYIAFTHNGTVYELHADTKYEAVATGVKLEVDISITTKAEADLVRTGQIPAPRSDRLKLILEAKHYGKTASTEPAKTYLATCSHLHTGNTPEGLVLSGAITPNAASIATTKGYHVYEEVTPLAAHQAQLTTFKSDLESALRNCL
jgi:hypothetical protein